MVNETETTILGCIGLGFRVKFKTRPTHAKGNPQ